MTRILMDARFWWVVNGIALGIFLGAVLLLAAQLLARRRPRVIGAVRERCELCEDAWANPSADDDLDLCSDCRASLEEAERLHAERDREVLR